jgi:threonine dehydrogenase-like Zn-dependent dehydrogenase
MRAMVFDGNGPELRLMDMPVPEPDPGQVRIRVEACGVCRTDLHVVDGDLKHPVLPLVPGHEIVGRIDALGEGVSALRTGQRVGVPWLGHTCGSCAYCSSGHENLCDHPEFTGYTVNGGYAEYCAADARFVFPLPEDRDAVELAPLLCAGLIGYRSFRLAGSVSRLGIYGFGAAAHILCQIAQYEGVEVYAFTRDGDTAAQDFALKLGALVDDLAGFAEGDIGEFFGDVADFPGVLEQEHRLVVAVVGDRHAVALDHLLQGLAVGLDPARGGVGNRLEADLGAVFGRRRSTTTSSCSTPTTPTIQLEPRSGLKIWTRPSSARSCRPWRICLTRMVSDSRTRRRISGAKAGRPVTWMFSPSVKRVADAELAVVRNTDHVARIGGSAISRSSAKKKIGAETAMVLAGAHVFQLHAALEGARTQAHEGDPVAVLRVHVGLHLEDKAGDLVLFRHDGPPAGRRLGVGRRGVVGDEVEHFLDAIVAQRGAEEHRGQVAFQEAFLVEFRVAFRAEFDVFGPALPVSGRRPCR